MNSPIRAAVALFLLLGSAPVLASAQQVSPTLKTHNIVLIVSDGLRWQEIFTGADSTLLNDKDGGIWDDEKRLRRDYWRDDVSERRRALFPFLLDCGGKARTDLRQWGQGQHGSCHERSGFLLSWL